MIYILFIFARTHTYTLYTIVTTPLRRGSVDGIIKPSHVEPIPEWPGRAVAAGLAGGERATATKDYTRRVYDMYV